MKRTENKTQTGKEGRPALVCRKCGNNLHSQACFIAHKREGWTGRVVRLVGKGILFHFSDKPVSRQLTYLRVISKECQQ
jgi:hypothetical protein